jgi:outer membrane biosynthesis protein TonB
MTLNCRENPPRKTLSRLAAMRRSVACVSVLAAALLLVSCGGEDAELLPGETAREITENLDEVKRLADEGDCAGAAGAVQEVGAQVEALDGVDAELERVLERGTTRLNEVVATCEEEDTEAIAPPEEETTDEGDEELPPGQEKKEEKEREKEEKEAEKEAEEAEKEAEEAEKEEEAPPPPNEDGGTGAPGGVSPATPAPEVGDEGDD